MKKLILVLAGMLLMTATAYAADYSPWAEESIEKAVEAGIVPDTLQSDYINNITRSEFCQLAVQTYMAKTGYTIPEGLQTPFTDIDDDYVTAAYTLGIVSGVGNDMFNPDSAITRQEAAVMLNNLAYMAGVDNSNVREDKFADEEYFAHWAEDAIYKVSAVDSGGTPVMTGTGNNKFSPWMNYTREQAIATMYRLYGCEAVPVLIPRWDDSRIYYESTYYKDSIYAFDTKSNDISTVLDLSKGSGGSIWEIVTISGNEIYYILNKHLDSSEAEKYESWDLRSKTLYKVNTDGTDNIALTPTAFNTYVGHRYIYYVPLEGFYKVIRTNLDGTEPVAADFSEMCGDKAQCKILADKGEIAYIYVDSSQDRLYAYDFSIGSAVELPEDTNIDCLKTGTLYDGKYKYYVYVNYYDRMRNAAYYELHRCKTDGSEDIVLNPDLGAYGYLQDLQLYKNKIYANGRDGIIYIYDEQGNEYIQNGTVLFGIKDDKIYYKRSIRNPSAIPQYLAYGENINMQLIEIPDNSDNKD